jgi:hypothetical protein
MATLVLPIDNTDDALIRVELEGVTFGFRTYWNARNASWYLDIQDIEGNDISAGKRIGANALLNRSITQMAGDLLAVSLDDTDTSDPGRLDLGQRVIIAYVESDA